MTPHVFTNYSFEDEYGVERAFTTRDPNRAARYAREHGLRCWAVRYEAAMLWEACDRRREDDDRPFLADAPAQKL